MKNLRNRNHPPNADLVQVYLQSSWDIVIKVYENLGMLTEIGDAIDAGDLDAFLAETDIDTIEKLNAILTNADLGDFASQAEAEAGLSATKTMSPLRVAQAIAVFASPVLNNYDAAGPPTINDDAGDGYAAGSVWIDTTDVPNEAYRCSDPTLGAAVWLKTTLTTDELALVAMTGNSDDLLEGVVKLLMTVAERAKLLGIEAGATGDMTAAEIKTAYESNANTNAYNDAEKASNAASLKDADFPAEGMMRAVNGAGGYATIKTFLNATTDPGVNNDSSTGYGISSVWVNTTANPNKLFICKDASVGAAVWQEVGAGGAGGLAASVKTANYTIVGSEDVGVDSTAGVFTISLKASPAVGDVAFIHDVGFNCETNPVAIARNGSTIDGLAEDASIDLNGGGLWFIHNGTTWTFTPIATNGGTIPGSAAASQTEEMIAGFIASPSNKDYRIVIKMAHAGTATETTTRSASGTCTATFKVNTTAFGGTANAVSSSEQSQAHASSNTWIAGDDIVLTVSSNSSCADMSFNIKYTRTLE